MRIMVALVVAGLAVTPALAQTQTQTPAGQSRSTADCQANFKSADTDGNGTLTKAEMSSASNVVPTAVSSQDSVTMQQFLTACTANVPKGG
jgi:Ca2+-binding EF-hand superfamily protein